MMPYTVRGLREIKDNDVDIAISLKKLLQCVKEINDCSRGRISWPKDELISKQITVIRMHKDKIEEVLDG